MFLRHKLLQLTSILVILTILFSGFPMGTVLAQGKDGLKREVNPQTGRVSFLSPENGISLPASQALGGASPLRPADPAMALAKRFGPEFGLVNPERDLSPMKNDRAENGHIIARYQQTYQGLPVLGGELIVNTDDSGDLYSMNGEVSPGLSLPTQPAIDSDTAKQTVLQAAAKWYEKTSDDFQVSEPQLWIYDESLLRPSTRPVELVWRMEAKAKDIGMPVRELVLVDAQRGNISLHFNEIDTAWGKTQKAHSVLNTTQFTTAYMPPLAGLTWYVATTGNNGNSCSSVGSPCATINGAIGKAGAGDTINVAIGTYTGTGTEVVLINKDITLSGGWNASFTTQSGISTIDGQAARRGILNNSGVTSTIERFIVQNCYTNNGAPGAGIENYGGTMTLKESTISGNDAGYSGYGGGIANVLGGVLIINSSTVSGNRVNTGGGGGIVNVNSTLTLNNSTISGNTTNYDAGGIKMSGGSLVVNNSTIYGNVSTYTYGVGIYNNGGGGSVTIKNTILAGNIGPYLQGSDCAGPIVSAGYNLIGILSTADCEFTPTTGDIVGPAYLPPIDPLLTPLQNNGGFTLTHAPYSISLAFNAGNPATPGSGGDTCLATDQRGVARPVGGRCDMGAYEGSIPWTPAYRVSTYTANDTSSLPGTFLCNQNDPNCAAGDWDAKSAHKYAIGTYNLFAAQFNRDSIDNHGMTLVSTVHYCDQNSPCPYNNAEWTGEQMVYGDAYRFALADDVVAHEFTHGVTQYESNLFYYYQSGAINESFSDLWGEYYDQTNGLGSDTPGHKWLLGEDVLGARPLRNMSDPTIYGDPDRMSSPNYYEGEDDNGGVHYNSGLNNKAVFLMVDGGFFNGKTVSALGWTKTAAIYYEVNTNLLWSGADYWDLYYALQQACTNLIGQKGITAGDCGELKDALDAVEMNGQPAPNFTTDAPYCDIGNPATTIFSDNLESGTGNWTFSNGAYPRWRIDSPDGPYAQSGIHSLYASDIPDVVTDAIARTKFFAVPGNAYLRFAQAFGFEFEPSPIVGDPTLRNYDGGVLEYSINNGSTWVDAGPLMDFNGYRGTIYTGAGNPLSGRSAFVDSSHGYISTRLNLASLAGKTVSFRWRLGLDQAGFDSGWWVDNIQVYTCPVMLSISGNAGVGGATLSYSDGSPKTTTTDGSGNYSINVPSGWSGTLTPSKAGYGFNPTSRTYSNLQSNQTVQNYTAFPVHSISGNVGVAGATLSYTDGTAKVALSQADGSYLLLVSSNWSGAVTPSHPCYTFSPANNMYSNVITDQTGQDYTPTFNNAPICAVTTGVFRPSNGLLYLKNSNTTGFADVALNYGIPGDYPVVGDWDGDGAVTIGIYRNGKFYLRNSNTIGFADWVFAFGQIGDQPIAGDWDGNGVDTIGVYRPSTGLFLLRNSNSAGNPDASFYLGNVGDVGIAGDWNGDGKDTTGVFRPINGIIFLKNTNTTGFADIALNYGIPGDKPVIGDWNNDGTDTIGVYRNGIFLLRNSNTVGFADISFGLGNPGDMPIAGNWDALP